MPAFPTLALSLLEDFFAGATVKALLVDGSYVPDVAHQFVSDVTDAELSGGGYARVTCTGVSVALAPPPPPEEPDPFEEFPEEEDPDTASGEVVVTCDDLEFGPLDASVNDVGGVIFYLDSGSDATSQLLSHDLEGPFDPPNGVLTYHVDPAAGFLTATA